MSDASAVAQLSEELRRVVWRHAVDLYAYFGKPVEQLSREQISVWIGLRAEFERRVAEERALLDGNGKPWGRTPKPGVEDPQNWIAEFDDQGKLRGYLRVRPEPSFGTVAASAPVEAAAEQLGKLAGVASMDGDLQAGRDAATVIAEMAAPLKPHLLREELRRILVRNSPASVMQVILHALEDCVSVFSDEGDEKGRAEALHDAAAVRAALESLSRTSWKPFHDARSEAPQERKPTT